MTGIFERRAAGRAREAASDAIKQIGKGDYDDAIALLNEAISHARKASASKKEGK